MQWDEEEHNSNPLSQNEATAAAAYNRWIGEERAPHKGLPTIVSVFHHIL